MTYVVTWEESAGINVKMAILTEDLTIFYGTRLHNFQVFEIGRELPKKEYISLIKKAV